METNADEVSFRAYFSLNERLSEVAARMAEVCPEIAPIIGRLGGLRLCQPQCAEDTLFCFLCTSNNNLSRIGAMIETLAGFGDVAFPTARRIAEIPEAVLRARGFGYRAKSIVQVARILADRGDGWLASLRNGQYPAASDELIRLPGIGPKLADCICLYGLHHRRAVPVDTHLWQSACRHFFPGFSGASLTAKRYREIGEAFRSRFGELAGWAQLFFYYDNMLRSRTGARSESS